MFDDALNQNINMIAVSGYRSYYVQENLYNSRIELKGLEKTRQYTAEPGASEHQTGLAIDIAETDYPYEPWHFRYIGDIDIAKEIMERGICFEEYIQEVKSKIEKLKKSIN